MPDLNFPNLQEVPFTVSIHGHAESGHELKKENINWQIIIV